MEELSPALGASSPARCHSAVAGLFRNCFFRNHLNSNRQAALRDIFGHVTEYNPKLESCKVME